MRKTWIVIGIIVIVIGGAMAYLLLSGSPSSQPASTDTGQASDLPAGPNPESQIPNTQQSPATPGTYTSYNQEVFAKTTGRRVLFFYAAWCPQCRALEQSIQSGTIPSGVTIFKVDYDTSVDLRQKYGVSLQTTLVEIGVHGNEVGKYVAYDTPTLEAVIKGLKL